nr:FAD-binding oxidoreductase [Polymorphobacter sp.]
MATLLADPLVDTLTKLLGADAVLTDAATLDLLSQDVFSRGAMARAVIRPSDAAALAKAVGAVTAAGVAVVPRGGGMSYTAGYLPRAAGAVVVDTTGMDGILAIDAVNMTVKVEAGCTWAKLYAALQPLGLRPPFWGTLSGRYATIGAGMSQNGLFWGAKYGTAVDSALSFEVVLADGSLVSTGSGFFRPFGPDLTGLFGADTGALGIKATVTLKLMREAACFAFASFSFPTADAILGAISDVAREGLASEVCGFDPFLQAQRMQRESLGADAKALLGVMKAQGSLLGALKEGARVVAAGRNFLDGVPFSAHFTTEGRTQTRCDEDRAEIAAIAKRHGGTEVENTIPKVMRANPFGPVNSMLGPQGERWVPVHGVVRHGDASAVVAAIGALYARHEPEMTALGIGAGYMFAIAGTTGVLIEPVFFWPDAIEALHRASVEPEHLARLKGFAANPAARAVVEMLRAGLVDLFHDHGAIHLQIGRTYRWHDSLDAPAAALMAAVKRQVDPRGLMNPGVLGL